MTVSWTATNLPGGAPVAGYEVRRYSTGGVLQTTGSGCSGTVTATSCTETGVPGGAWRYSVTPRQGNWRGGESSQSTSVSVSSPSLSISSGSPMSALPGTLSATLASFAAGQTVAYRLDDATTGTLLTATTTPSTIPSSGDATASVTIPAGTTGGTHTLYAIGSGGDVASASFTVAATYTVTTSAWDLRDYSSGALVNATAQPAFADDGRTLATGNWGTAFSTARYVEFDMSNPLPAGQSVSGATFNYRRAASTATDTVCFYFETRRISTGAVLAVHGSSASPVGCVTGTALVTTSAALPEINTSDLANDVRVRVYVRSTGSLSATIDLAVVSGSTSGTSFTAYPALYTDAASGTATSYPWSQSALDATTYDIGTNWAGAFDTTRYLRFAFPGYVPAGAAVSGATLTHTFGAVGGNITACFYADVYSGTTLIATKGSSASPAGCVTGTTQTSVSVAIPEVNTPARANDLNVRLYFRTAGNGNRRTQHDATELSVTYGG